MRLVHFHDRVEAGRALGEALKEKDLSDPIILALPRGGVPVGLEVARALRAPLGLVLVRKIGVPFQPELAAGAVVDGDDGVRRRGGSVRADRFQLRHVSSCY